MLEVLLSFRAGLPGFEFGEKQVWRNAAEVIEFYSK